MKTKTIQQLKDQWRRIEGFSKQKGWHSGCVVSYCIYIGNMAEHLNSALTLPFCEYNNIPVPLNIYAQ